MHITRPTLHLRPFLGIAVGLSALIRHLSTGQDLLINSHALLKNIPIRMCLVGAAMLGFFACSDSINAPVQGEKGFTLSHMIMCDANNYCISDGGDDGVGPQTLSVVVHSGCIHGNYQHLAGSCSPPTAGVTGGTSGSYRIAWYQSHCNGPDAEIGPNYCEPFDTLSAGHLTFTSSDYEIDLTAQVQEVGGNGLTGVGVMNIMGPGSVVEGTEVGCTGTNASNDIIDEFPFYQLAKDQYGMPIYEPHNGQVTYKDFARNPCTNEVVFSPNDPHSIPPWQP